MLDICTTMLSPIISIGNQDQYLDVVKTIEENSYAEDIPVMGDNEADLLKETKKISVQVMMLKKTKSVIHLLSLIRYIFTNDFC